MCLKSAVIPTVVHSGIFQHGVEGIHWCGMSAVEGAETAGLGLVNGVKQRQPVLVLTWGCYSKGEAPGSFHTWVLLLVGQQNTRT